MSDQPDPTAADDATEALRRAREDLDGIERVAIDDQPAVFERIHGLITSALDATVDKRPE